MIKMISAMENESHPTEHKSRAQSVSIYAQLPNKSLKTALGIEPTNLIH